MQIMIVSHRKHLRAFTVCYGDSFAPLCVDGVRTSQEKPMGLHCLPVQFPLTVVLLDAPFYGLLQ
jgi:hypothetical protein